MNRLTIRFPQELYDALSELAVEEDIPMADVVRQAVSHFLEARQTGGAALADAGRRREIEQLHEQIQAKDEQIDQLHQLLGIAQKNAGDLTEQLNRVHLQLEDHRRSRRWWKFWA